MAYQLPKKIKILDYFTMEILNEDGVTPAASDGKLRGACKVCGRSYSGTERVKSNFISHLRKCHPIEYDEFQIGSGKKNVLSVATLNDPATALATIRNANRLQSQQPYSPAAFPNFKIKSATPTTITTPPVFPSTSSGHISNPKVAVLPERRSLPSTSGRQTEYVISAVTKIVTGIET